LIGLNFSTLKSFRVLKFSTLKPSNSPDLTHEHRNNNQEIEPSALKMSNIRL
jgi:hypothetical protein